MISSREKYIKLIATVGIILLFINTQLSNTQSPATYSPQVRSNSETVGRTLLTAAAGACGAGHEGEERLARDSLLALWEETEGSPQTLQQEAEVSCGSFIYLIKCIIRIFSRFDLKHHLMYCENYKELLLPFSPMFPEGDSKSM